MYITRTRCVCGAENGADPFHVSKYGDDAIQTACVKGAILVFNYFVERLEFNLPHVSTAFIQSRVKSD